MITPSHRQKLTDSKYFHRLLRLPWRVRCLPMDPMNQDKWLPLPEDTHGEVQSVYEAALGGLPLELADYAVCRPRIVGYDYSGGYMRLTPPSLEQPQVIWLRWHSTRTRTNLLINPLDRTYFLTSGPAFVSADIPNTSPTDYRKTAQLKNWLEWLAKVHPDIHAKLILTRP